MRSPKSSLHVCIGPWPVPQSTCQFTIPGHSRSMQIEVFIPCELMHWTGSEQNSRSDLPNNRSWKCYSLPDSQTFDFPIQSLTEYALQQGLHYEAVAPPALWT